MEKFSTYKFRLYKKNGMTGWDYQIFDDTGVVLRESKETYMYEGIARLAVIGHITLLEQNKG